MSGRVYAPDLWNPSDANSMFIGGTKLVSSTHPQHLSIDQDEQTLFVKCESGWSLWDLSMCFVMLEELLTDSDSTASSGSIGN